MVKQYERIENGYRHILPGFGPWECHEEPCLSKQILYDEIWHDTETMWKCKEHALKAGWIW